MSFIIGKVTRLIYSELFQLNADEKYACAEIAQLISVPLTCKAYSSSTIF